MSLHAGYVVELWLVSGRPSVSAGFLGFLLPWLLCVCVSVGVLGVLTSLVVMCVCVGGSPWDLAFIGAGLV